MIHTLEAMAAEQQRKHPTLYPSSTTATTTALSSATTSTEDIGMMMDVSEHKTAEENVGNHSHKNSSTSRSNSSSSSSKNGVREYLSTPLSFPNSSVKLEKTHEQGSATGSATAAGSDNHLFRIPPHNVYDNHLKALRPLYPPNVFE